MVAVRTRTAGQQALRRTPVQSGPGMFMPGAAACASGACEWPDCVRLPDGSVQCCLSLFSSLPCRFMHRPASTPAARFSGSSAIVPAFLRPRRLLRMSRPFCAACHALCACVRSGCSGMDIAGRNPVIAAGWRYGFSWRVRARVWMSPFALRQSDEGFCGLHDSGADGVQCARRVAYE